MKHNFTLIILLLALPIFLSAQSNRMVLAEGFTSTTCGPCASLNPAFDALLHANTDKITSIKYHMSWPSPGNDPMYLHNTVDNNARRTYYNVNAVPHVVIGGNVQSGSPSTVNQAKIDSWASVPSPFDIVMQHRISDNMDSVHIVMLIKANEAVSGNLVAHIAVIEKAIHFTSAPGTNGEKDFYNVMKALLPTRSGTSLDPFEADEYVIIEASWELQNVYNIDQIAAVGFVQNNSTKAVHQAANSSAEPLQPFFGNDGAVKNIINGMQMNCSGTMEPSAQIVNYGSETMTSAVVNFKVNGEVLQTIEWSGNLGFLESATVDADLLVFEVQDENELEIEISSVNGVQDEYPKNNSFIMPFVISEDNPQPPVLFILLDNNPEEVTWEVRDSGGNIVDSGGPYTAAGTVISQQLQVSNVDCYTFTIYDAGGDGLCCSNGVGYYAVMGSGTDPMFTGQNFGSSETNEFYFGYVGLENQAESLEVALLPNPASEVVRLQLNMPSAAQALVQLTDLQGRELLKTTHSLDAGMQTVSLDLSNLMNGLYMVNIIVDGQVITKKLMVE